MNVRCVDLKLEVEFFLHLVSQLRHYCFIFRHGNVLKPSILHLLRRRFKRNCQFVFFIDVTFDVLFD